MRRFVYTIKNRRELSEARDDVVRVEITDSAANGHIHINASLHFDSRNHLNTTAAGFFFFDDDLFIDARLEFGDMRDNADQTIAFG